MNTKRIMLVEDEGLLAMEIERNLKASGFKLAGTYASGEAAIEALREMEAEHALPSLILMDIRLQGELGGIETARQITKVHELPIIFLTAHADDSTLKEATTTTPYGYLVKPVDAQDLNIAIIVALHKYQVDKDKERLTRRLSNALDQVKQLSGLLPICSWCKRVRNDQGYWQQIESYISEHTAAEFSHCICDECKSRVKRGIR